MDLILKVSTPNNNLQKLVGKDEMNRITSEAFDKYDNTCQCCGWKPLKEDGEDEGQFDYKKKHLIIHVDRLNEEKPSESDVILSCRSCYVINHLDLGVNKGFVKLVNSHLSQKDLIKICWSDVSRDKVVGNNIENAKNDRMYIPLTCDPKEFLSKIEGGYASETVKVIFTKEFLER